jgi:hypothetical protein
LRLTRPRPRLLINWDDYRQKTENVKGNNIPAGTTLSDH